MAAVVALALIAPFPAARAAASWCGGSVVASVKPFFADPNFVPQLHYPSVDNGCIRREWDPLGIATDTVLDERTGATFGSGDDFSLRLDGVEITSGALVLKEVSVAGSGSDHATITWAALLPGRLEVRRTVDVYAGVTGFKSQTTITSLAPIALGGYTLDRLKVGDHAVPSITEFRAGADWHEDWKPEIAVGNAHTGDWRQTTTGVSGAALGGTSEWTAASLPSGEHVAMVSERRDYASSVGSYDGLTLSGGVDFSRDVDYIGPFEEQAHIENPGPGPARHRVLEPGQTLALEPGFTAIGTDADDAAWQFSKYLTTHRMPDYDKAVVFNSDGVDHNVISTGSKDDMSYSRMMQILPTLQQMGVETFVFDDGWQAASGDWCPDSPGCPEPRAGTDPARFGPRFPDDQFGAVRTALQGAGMKLGLWMSPMAFHPASAAFRTNPQWSCAPVGTGTAALSVAKVPEVNDPNSGSNEAGIGLWNPRALGVDPDNGKPERMIDYLESRIRRAIDTYGARYFKFDFLVWTDCVGAQPSDIYQYHDEFMAMRDRLETDHPEVTFQIDDTNDYRGFPFETIARGPSWFLNGGSSYDKVAVPSERM
ncbi:MAG: hypothetical protein ABR552_09440, partial [Actinomycetota bacterium]